MIMEKNAFDYCTVITAAHPNVLIYEDTISLEDREDYIKLKRDIKSWMGVNQQVISILYADVDSFYSVDES